MGARSVDRPDNGLGDRDVYYAADGAAADQHLADLADGNCAVWNVASVWPGHRHRWAMRSRLAVRSYILFQLDFLQEGELLSRL